MIETHDLAEVLFFGFAPYLDQESARIARRGYFRPERPLPPEGPSGEGRKSLRKSLHVLIPGVFPASQSLA
jgi:hypothetical protein